MKDNFDLLQKPLTDIEAVQRNISNFVKGNNGIIEGILNNYGNRC